MDYSRLETWLKAHRLAGYALAAALAVLSLVVRLTLGRELSGVPFLTFFPAILITTALAGRGPGLTCTALSGVLAWAFLIPAGVNLGFPWPSRTVALCVYFGVAMPMTWLFEGFLSAYRRLRDAEITNIELLKDLEARVETRTRELTEANRQLVAEAATRRDAEAQVAQYQRLEAVGQLVGGISHDFNNLLGVVIGNLDLAKRRLARGDTDIQPHLTAAFEGAQRGASLTQRLLAFARKQPLNPDITDVNALLVKIADLLKATAGERIHIDVALDDHIGTSRIDARQLENAVLNLAINSRDAINCADRPDGGRITIATSSVEIGVDDASASEDSAPGHYVVVSVTDTGAGMTPEVAARAFEPFFTTKGVGQGTGLGLSQIHGFLKQSGGFAAIASTPGEGTTIRMHLPRHDGAGRPDDAAPADKTAPRQGRTCKVLVVEDQADVRATTIEVLKELGYAVAEAEDGKTALDILSDDADIELLLTDIVMPGLLGTELADRARALRPGLRIVYTSGFPGETLTPQHESLPPGSFLPKPFTPEDLARTLARSLDGALPD